MAVVLSFYGDSEKVDEFMQKASHRTRAYHVNANLLKGFLVLSIITILKRAEARQELDKVI